MAKKTIYQPLNKKTSKTKITVIQEMYGKDRSTTTLADTSAYLKKAGFNALADLLHPAK